MKPLPASLYRGIVGHTRYTPRKHALRYPILSILTDIDGEERADSRMTGWSPRDHGCGEAGLRPFVTEKLEAVGVHQKLGRIQILTAPKQLGLVFNPLSVFLAFDRQDQLCGVLFEVNNFHAGRGCYAFSIEAPEQPVLTFECPKAFFVSPFNPVEGVYYFRLEQSEARYQLGIKYERDGVHVMSAVHTARPEPLRAGLRRRRQVELLINTPRTVAGILFEALKLRLKGLQLFTPRRGTVDTRPWRS